MDVIIDNLPLFWSGLLQSLEICAYGAVGSLVLGILIAVMRVSPIPILQRFGATWVQVVRNCPLTVFLFFFAFGLPELAINASYFSLGVTGLVVYTSAFVCEAVRSGVLAVPVGQAEASRALGLSFGQGLRRVMLPQAMRSTVPPLTNALVAMIKNSAIVGAFGVGNDLFSVGNTLTAARGLPAIPVLTGVVIAYLVIILPAAAVMSVVERKVAILR